MSEFQAFPKIPRFSRDIIVTEKIDGTNAQIYITDDGDIFTGSRNRWITPENDNYGFAKWVDGNKDLVLKLGAGRHFGEWWGLGIQRGYGLKEKRFSLFNTSRWDENNIPEGLYSVPVLYKGDFSTIHIDQALYNLCLNGSEASKGFMKPEGIIIYHTVGGYCFKKTIEKDHLPKGVG
jgi:hypothetical protein